MNISSLWPRMTVLLKVFFNFKINLIHVYKLIVIECIYYRIKLQFHHSKKRNEIHRKIRFTQRENLRKEELRGTPDIFSNKFITYKSPHLKNKISFVWYTDSNTFTIPQVVNDTKTRVQNFIQSCGIGLIRFTQQIVIRC